MLRTQLRKGPTRFWYESVVGPSIRRWRSSVLDQSPMPIPLHAVGGHQHVMMTAWMLASFVEATQRNWEVRFHDDGTLTESDIEFLANFMPSLQIIRRADADERMKDKLSAYPLCRQYRDEIPLALKCFDVPECVDSDDGRFLLIDPDVLFWGNVEEILEWVDHSPGSEDARACWFNRDPQEPSPISPQEAQDRWNISLWRQVNSGLCLLNQEIGHLADFEAWLGDPALQQAKLWRKEQTLLALAASKADRGGLLAPKYEVSLGRECEQDSVCRHYVGAVRNRFWTEGVRKVHPKIFR